MAQWLGSKLFLCGHLSYRCVQMFLSDYSRYAVGVLTEQQQRRMQVCDNNLNRSVVCE